MPRKKVKLAWIANDSARRATFKKRKKGLMKKVSELSTLCGVKACAIVYGAYDPEPEVWSSHSNIEEIVNEFKSMPEMEQSKKMMNQEGYLRQRVLKLKEQVRRQQRENREYEITQLMYQTLGGRKGLHQVFAHDLSDLAWVIDENIRAIQERMEMLRTAPQPQQQHQQEMNTTGQVERLMEEKRSLEAGAMVMDPQSWFTMNPQEHVSYVGDDIYGDTVNSWANAWGHY